MSTQLMCALIYSTNQMCFHHNLAVGLSVVTVSTDNQLICISIFKMSMVPVQPKWTIYVKGLTGVRHAVAIEKVVIKYI